MTFSATNPFCSNLWPGPVQRASRDMARTKRAPVKRDASSEFFDKKTAAWQNGNGAAAQAGSPASGEAGILQLVISVAGIYASLYVNDRTLNTERLVG